MAMMLGCPNWKFSVERSASDVGAPRPSAPLANFCKTFRRFVA